MHLAADRWGACCYDGAMNLPSARIPAFLFHAVPAMVLCTALAACGADRDGMLDIAIVGGRDATLSDTRGLTAAGGMIRAATHDGLVSFDAEGLIQPGLAERWIVTDDGLSYIFRLGERPGPGGADTERARDAEAVADALRKAIAAQDGTAFGLDLAIIEEVVARTGRVIEIRLTAPNPEFLNLMAQPQLSLADISATDKGLSLDEKRDMLVLDGARRRAEDGTEEQARPLNLLIAEPERAVSIFQAGRANVMLGGAIDALPHVELGGLLQGAIRLDPVVGLFGLSIARREDGFLSLSANREALAMAIDRNGLILPFGIAGGWVPTTRLVPPGLPGDTGMVTERWDGIAFEERQAVAAGQVARWRASGQPRPAVSVALPPGRGGEILFEQLRSDLADVGIALRMADDADADLRLIDEVADYDRADWYLNRFNCTVTDALCSKEADALVAASRTEPDPAIRALLLANAEALLSAQNVFVPFGPPVRFSLVRGGLEGFAVNRWGVHPLSALSRGPS
ncbi:ABC transporter substrate-binding protein [Croceicoccus hydrothermalis]|uniref:ABC transporter substrate-binding protein n=1 Tax=Croceicoccus hydrothermalis TaxID=2867964 RepID=UPI001EFB18B2|nr:ABC transporter substrate-binding protein [Croceicoccus hydrothermalis]